MGRAKTASKKIRVQAVVDEKYVKVIDELAGRLNITRSHLLSVLIEQALENEGWVIRLISSRFMRPAQKLVAWLSKSDMEQVKAKRAQDEKEAVDG